MISAGIKTNLANPASVQRADEAIGGRRRRVTRSGSPREIIANRVVVVICNDNASVSASANAIRIALGKNLDLESTILGLCVIVLASHEFRRDFDKSVRVISTGVISNELAIFISDVPIGGKSS